MYFGCSFLRQCPIFGYLISGIRSDAKSILEVLNQMVGCIGIQVRDSDKIKPALKEALETDGPVLIDIVTDSLAHPTL